MVTEHPFKYRHRARPAVSLDVALDPGIGFARMKSNLLLVAAGLAGVGTAQKAKVSKCRL